MNPNVSRRLFIKSTALSSSAILLGQSLATSAQSPSAAPAPLPPRPTVNLDPKNPTATALGYVEDHTKADSTKFPQLKTPEGKLQKCSNCLLFNAPQNAWGQCTIFPQGLVNENGWCLSWAKKARA